MPRFAGVSAGVLLPVAVAVVVALSGCSSSSGDDKAQPTGKPSVPAAPAASESASSSQDSGGVHGRLDYTGSLSGGFDVTTSVGCATLDGKLVAVTAPDPNDASASTVPSFVAGIASESMATLVTPDKHTFVKIAAGGLTGAKQGDVWTVTVSGAELGAADASGGSVTVNGHLICTTTSGT